MVWTALQKYSTMGIQFISGIILARLLTPYDYGCIGMLSIFMALSETFIDGGFGSALIQKKRPTQEDYSTIFFWNIGMAFLMYAILFLCAPAIARFYDIPLLSKVLRIQGLVLFIFAFNIIQRNQLRKTMDFRAISIVTVVTSFVSLGITIILAYKGFGVWALVAQNMITAVIPATVFWFYLKWRPSFVFSRSSFKELFGFGFYMFLTHLVNQFGKKLSGLLIGKIYNPTTLGYYSKASRTEALASSSISAVLTQITYPLYAHVQDDRKALQRMIKRLTTTIAYLTFPTMALLVLTAKPLFILLYSDRWVASIPYFQVLCLVGLADCLQAVNTQSIAAIGKSKTMFTWTLIKRLVGTSFIVVGLLLWGLKGLLCGVVLYNWFCYFVNIGLVSKHIGYNWKRQLLDLMPTGSVTLILFTLCFLLGRILPFGMYVNGAIIGLSFIALYLGWSLLSKSAEFYYILDLIPSRWKVWKVLKKRRPFVWEIRWRRKERKELLQEANKHFEEERPEHGSLSDYKKALWRHRFTYREYMHGYELWGLNDAQRDEFLSQREMWCIYRKTIHPDVRKCLMDKGLFLKTFSHFVHRRWILAKDVSFEGFVSFVSSNDCIAKPLLGDQGKGIMKLSRSDNKDLDYLYTFFKENNYLLEERIIEIHELEEFHPASLNTIRVVTMSGNGKVEVLGALFRMGAHGNFVDNTHSGGVFAAIDTETGMLLTDGLDLNGRIYPLHPDTGKAIKGYTIPYWDACLAVCSDAALAIPGLFFAGWDICILPGGQVELIEGNSAPDVDGGLQAPLKKGIKKQVQSFGKRLFGFDPLTLVSVWSKSYK